MTPVERPDAVGKGLAELVLSMYEEDTVAETLERVLDFALTAVNCSHAAVLFVHAKDTIETIACTHPALEGLAERETELREGPDISIIRDRRTLIVDDTHQETRWPEWAAAAAAAGFRSMVGVLLYTSDRTIGTLNLYDSRPSRFSDEDRQVAHVLARHAAIALGQIEESDNLWRAIDARKLIGQAQGILMERFDIDEGQSFAVLRRYSQVNNIKLREVARTVVETRRLPEPPIVL
jgi:GAF domain-containing protein